VLVRVVSASVLVAQSSLAAFVAGAAEDTVFTARVRCDLVGTSVGLPDIHLVAADALALDVSLIQISQSIRRKGVLYLLHR
jgi:hypothetical protein